MQYGELRGVLTAAHVVEGSTGEVTCTWPDGHQDTGSSQTCKFKNDVAFVAVTHPSLSPVQFSLTAPKPGDILELAGYGGPQGDMRHFAGRVISADKNDGTSGTEIDFCVLNGDSGSGILNEVHEVVAIQSVGIGQAIDRRGNWPVYGRSGSANYASIRGFLDRVGQKIGAGGSACGPGGCSPSPGGGGRGGGGGGIADFYPPKGNQQDNGQAGRPPVTPDKPGISPPQVAGFDKILDRLDSISDRMSDIEKKRQGPEKCACEGECKCDSMKGCECDQTQIAQAVINGIDYAKIAAMVKVEAPPTVPAPVAGKECHMVLVADQKASYWPRLEGELKRAQEAYYGIKVAPVPPFKAGPMPQLVVYESSIPTRVVKGSYDVSTALTEISRGDWK